MGYAEEESVDSGLQFETKSGLKVETTGVTLEVEAHDMFVHEVVILEGVGEGNKYLHNLDSATPLGWLALLISYRKLLFQMHLTSHWN